MDDAGECCGGDCACVCVSASCFCCGMSFGEDSTGESGGVS